MLLASVLCGWSPRVAMATEAASARSRRDVPVRSAATRPAPSRAVATLRPATARLPGASEMALAPAVRSRGNAGGLPQPLAPSDAARLRHIFEAQARGDVPAAALEMERLDDRRLVGHVLADRWLRPGAPEPATAELYAWLAENADHPDAPRIYALLSSRTPRGVSLPPAPPDAALSASAPDTPPEEQVPPARAVVRNPALDRSVRERAQAGESEAALRLISNTRGMTPAYASLLQAELAQTLFQQGKDDDAFRIAAAATRASPNQSLAPFVAGLAAWGRGFFDIALPYFEAAARADDGPAVLRSAAALWTARAAVRARKPQLYVPWMLQAAQEPRTFYGLVARRALGLPPGFAWERDLAGEAESAALAETAGGWRALALLQIGQNARAEAELRRLWPAVQNNPVLSRASLAVATQSGMTEFAAQIAGLAQTVDGRPRDFARFPVPRLDPAGGFRVDPALLYALVRQESNFDAGAVSPAGARGLMQLMPATASFMAGDPSLATAAGMQRLHDPSFSLDIGQRYLHHLARLDSTDGNLIRMLASYNAGPGAVQRWQPSNGHRDDPFLFIESIPLDETRTFVQRVLAYSWIYASRLGLPSASLDAMAAGAFPRFTTPGELERMVSRDGVRTVSTR
ncbi:transglycosylase SLT domain-containing protein [Roseomonas sp. BN140053]|uniref:transglycosylase SLT domain-containing protein n=1 Tax=Roseomonas sp. BN140053 TaxID=3391898 RepID=UPI0039EA21DC